MSLISDAFAEWRECRAEYEYVLYSQYEAALEGTHGALLNADGRRRQIDEVSLFMGPEARAHRYASEELIEWWRTHPRMPFCDFEKQWRESRDAPQEWGAA